MKKKLFALTLALLLALSLTACGGDSNTDDAAGGDDTQQADDANNSDSNSDFHSRSLLNPAGFPRCPRSP